MAAPVLLVTLIVKLDEEPTLIVAGLMLAVQPAAKTRIGTKSASDNTQANMAACIRSMVWWLCILVYKRTAIYIITTFFISISCIVAQTTITSPVHNARLILNVPERTQLNLSLLEPDD